MQQQEQVAFHQAEIQERADSRSSADLRRLALQEEQLAETADLPLVREKHRLAARSWIVMARDLERTERRCGAGDIALAG